MWPSRVGPLVGRAGFFCLLRPRVRRIAAPTRLRDMLATTSCSPHWPGAVNYGQWELRSAGPADAAGGQTSLACHRLALAGHVPKVADPKHQSKNTG